MADISDKLLMQRLRNRIMEVLDGFAEIKTVSVVGTDEIINRWDDVVDVDRFNFYSEPVFTHDELNLVKRFHYLLDCSYKEIPDTYNSAELNDCKEWNEIRSLAQEG